MKDLKRICANARDIFAHDLISIGHLGQGRLYESNNKYRSVTANNALTSGR